jgi:hypothetical protein
MGYDIRSSLVQVANAEGPTSITNSHLSNAGGAEAPISGTDGPSPPSIDPDSEESLVCVL